MYRVKIFLTFIEICLIEERQDRIYNRTMIKNKIADYKVLRSSNEKSFSLYHYCTLTC